MGWVASLVVLGCGGGGGGTKAPEDAGVHDAATPPDAGNDAAPPDECDADGGFAPTEPVLLTPDGPAEDEDPSVLRARDGSLVVAFFSNRGGNRDIYVVRTVDGESWSAPARVTTDPDDDFAPSLWQDDDGTFRLAWFRHMPADPYFSHVRFSRSDDGLTWDPADERALTTEPDGVYIDDWVPVLARAADGTLVVVFATSLRSPPLEHLFVTTSSDDGESWDAPLRLEDLVSAENDHLPFLARTGDELTLTWVRYADPDRWPWEDPTADVLVATSTDGIAWSAPVDVTHDDPAGALDLFPDLYATLGGEWFLAWLSTAREPGTVADLALDDLASYPDAVADLALPGYSARIAATTTPCVYLGVWVAGDVGVQDVWYRFFQK